MDRTELLMANRSVSAFISAKEVEIELGRPAKIDAGNGGWKPGPTTVLPPQLFRLVPFKRRLTHQESNTQDGPIPVLPYVLVGRPGVDVQRDDEFIYNDRNCKVIGVEPAETSDHTVVEFEMR